MPIYKYCCLTPGCEVKDVPGYRNFGGMTVRKDESKEQESELCPCCDEPMKLMGYVLSGGFSKTSLMDRNEKKNMLLKRSHEHFEKKIKPYKAHLNNEVRVQATEAFRRE